MSLLLALFLQSVVVLPSGGTGSTGGVSLEDFESVAVRAKAPEAPNVVVAYRSFYSGSSGSTCAVIHPPGQRCSWTIPRWDYHYRGFPSVAAALEWLNSTSNAEFTPRFDGEFIGLYRVGKPILVRLDQQERVEPERVEIKERRWTEKKWVLE